MKFLTCCKVRYRVTIYVRLEHRVLLHLHIPMDPIEICDPAIPKS